MDTMVSIQNMGYFPSLYTYVNILHRNGLKINSNKTKRLIYCVTCNLNWNSKKVNYVAKQL